MRKNIFFIVCVMINLSAKAQDLIVLKEANEIVAKVLKISSEVVEYKRWDNLDGPIYEISKHDIFYIKYQNGNKDIMSNNFLKEEPCIEPKENIINKKAIIFQCYTYGGVVFDGSSAGPTFDITCGVNIYDYLYIGPEIGFYTNFEKYRLDDIDHMAFGAYIPFGGNIKVFFLNDFAIIPFFNCSLAGFWGVAGILKNNISGFCGQIGFGIDLQDCSFSVGYAPLVAMNMLGISARIPIHCGYVKLGVRF